MTGRMPRPETAAVKNSLPLATTLSWRLSPASRSRCHSTLLLLRSGLPTWRPTLAGLPPRKEQPPERQAVV